uniref:Uncharacterized protein n=1 Tax=Trypanosoma vivax (strain Y486) TaxID=1055687 RepID=G0TSN5_TRYVY|nr:hypothetical protein TVY486_0301510 [Trypanosoma vivax Y486]
MVVFVKSLSKRRVYTGGVRWIFLCTAGLAVCSCSPPLVSQVAASYSTRSDKFRTFCVDGPPFGYARLPALITTEKRFLLSTRGPFTIAWLAHILSFASNCKETPYTS